MKLSKQSIVYIPFVDFRGFDADLNAGIEERRQVYVLTEDELEDLLVKVMLKYKPELSVNVQAKQFLKSIKQ